MIKIINKFFKRATAICMVSAITAVCLAGCSKETDNSNKTYIDLKSYFKLNGYVSGEENIPAATDDEYAVVIDGMLKSTRAKKINTGYYMDIECVNDYFNSGIYWDSNEEISLYTLPAEEIKISAGDKSYTMGGTTYEFDESIIVKQGTVTYILLDYVVDFTAMDYSVCENGANRISINTEYCEKQYVKAVKNLKMRDGENPSKEILTDITAETELYYVKDGETPEWVYVRTLDGIWGYVEKNKISEVYTNTVTTDFKEIIYPSISKDFEICLGWHQMESTSGNDSLKGLIKDAGSLNVVSPTWMKISDAGGGITSLVSESYVKTAHKNNLEVWALISDFNSDENGSYYINQVLPYSSKRKILVNNIINEIKKCGADGVNIDFEMISSSTADDFIQFLREMSLECRKEGIVLSVDNYAPTGGNSYYNREAQGKVVDYFIIMGYDEHWAGCGKAGSVASLPFVENGIKNTIAAVPAEKVINAVPFFTRVWMETPEALTDGTQVIIEDPIYGNYALSSKAVGLKSALNLVEKNKAAKTWLESLGQYYGEYKDDEGITYRIWLEEEESMTKKLELMDKYQIAGMAAWKLGLEYDDIWDVIDNFID